MAEQPAEEVQILEPLMRQGSPDAYLFKVYGLALSRNGQKTEAVKYAFSNSITGRYGVAFP